MIHTLENVSEYDEKLMKLITQRNMGLTAVVKFLESRFKYIGHSSIFNHSVNLYKRCNKTLTTGQINYARNKSERVGTETKM